MIGEVTNIPASNGDDFDGTILTFENVTRREALTLIGGTLSYPWELVELYAEEWVDFING